MKKQKSATKPVSETRGPESPFEVTVQPESDGKSVYESESLPTTRGGERFALVDRFTVRLRLDRDFEWTLRPTCFRNRFGG